MMRTAPRDHTGLALGAWGGVQATAAGLGIAIAGVVRDIVVAMPLASGTSDALPYTLVFGLEIVCLLIALAVALRLGRVMGRRQQTA